MYNKENYEKLKRENPERLKELRQISRINFKLNNSERLSEINRKASKVYYEKNKATILEKRRLKKLADQKKIEFDP
jgi:hypothetical protein